MRLTPLLATLGAVVIAATACKNKSPVEPKPGQPVVTTMTCDKGNGQITACEIPLTNAGSFTITLNSTDCLAHGNVLQVTKPTPIELTADGCYEQLGKEWAFTGPFAGSATMAMTVTSRSYDHPPQLKVTQNPADPSTWTVVFEDGYDSDFNDMVFTVKAKP
jgi:hypothetical protein